MYIIHASFLVVFIYNNGFFPKSNATPIHGIQPDFNGGRFFLLPALCLSIMMITGIPRTMQNTANRITSMVMRRSADR